VVRLVHLSDLHFGRDVDLEQVRVLETLVPELVPAAIVVSGDLTQRARHGEFQRAVAFVEALDRTAPTLTVPGNHDVEWWRSPFGIRGERPKYAKYRRYFGENLTPALSLPGVCIATMLSSYGVAFASMTSNLNDLAVKGHLPAGELARVRELFDRESPDTIRCVALHHNVLRGAISGRMGLARPERAATRLVELEIDLILCGHDHQEGTGQVGQAVVVSTAGTHTSRSRGNRPSAFNLIQIDERVITVQHLRWDRPTARFVPSDQARFVRARATG
jgi:3',5'-cyclic AMP phosphodiesterase CpdA